MASSHADAYPFPPPNPPTRVLKSIVYILMIHRRCLFRTFKKKMCSTDDIFNESYSGLVLMVFPRRP